MNTVLLKLKAFARYLQRGRYQKLWTEEAFVHLETRQADSVSGEHCASLTVKACLPLAKTTVLAETYFWINNIKLFWSESSYEHLSVWRHANILKVPMRLNKRGDVCMFFFCLVAKYRHIKSVPFVGFIFCVPLFVYASSPSPSCLVWWVCPSPAASCPFPSSSVRPHEPGPAFAFVCCEPLPRWCS